MMIASPMNNGIMTPNEASVRTSEKSCKTLSAGISDESLAMRSAPKMVETATIVANHTAAPPTNIRPMRR
jgi:hypothetical protein